jgi:hypothetical protein
MKSCLLNFRNMHRDRFLVNKTNRSTEFQFYWYYHSTCFRQSFCPSSGVLSRNRMELCSTLFLIANGHHNCINCTKADVRLRTPDDGQERLPETCRVVIPIKLEFGASVGLIHKESVFCFIPLSVDIHRFRIIIKGVYPP